MTDHARCTFCVKERPCRRPAVAFRACACGFVTGTCAECATPFVIASMKKQSDEHKASCKAPAPIVHDPFATVPARQRPTPRLTLAERIARLERIVGVVA